MCNYADIVYATHIVYLEDPCQAYHGPNTQFALDNPVTLAFDIFTSGLT